MPHDYTTGRLRFSRSVLTALLALACRAPGAPPIARDAGVDDPLPSDATVLADAELTSDAGVSIEDPWDGPPLGARLHPDGSLEVRVRSANATRIEVALFAAALGETERLRVSLDRRGDRFDTRINETELREAGLDGTIYYGLRVWGPNWPFDPSWHPGSEAGFVIDIDGDGNRMNPNKVVLDPYALEMSHDPRGPGHTDYGPFLSDPAHRAIDSGPFAPKGIVIEVPTPLPPGPGRALRDHVIYEVHVRGLTRGDETLPEAERGTYLAARMRARALRDLGITAVELLPLHETSNDQNDLTEDASGDNYWGYSTLSFFAPDRRYAADRSPGGPTRELQDMVRAFHDEGLEVFVDVVYNHTGEGTNSYLSWRGVDDATYYEHADDPRHYVDHNGVGPNVAAANPMVGDLIVDSLRYWHEVLGVDGFRFDLASILGNGCARGCFHWAPDGLLTRIARELGRDDEGGRGAILIAEPWGIGGGTYRVGEFPAGWAEWNDRYRDAVRRDLNRLNIEQVTLRELGRRIAGSGDLYADDGRNPAATINFVTAHDGFTLHDLFAYDTKVNDHPWPWGPSDGGTDDNHSWGYGGDAERQHRSARTAMALLAVSHGTPMILGGDEYLRTQRGNNNAYNLDSPAIWLDPNAASTEPRFHALTAALFAFRRDHRALSPARYAGPSDDLDADGMMALRWYRADGTSANDAYLDSADQHFASLVLDADELGDRDRAIWIAYSGWSSTVSAHPPPAPAGTRWHLAIDTGEAGSEFDYVHSDDELSATETWPHPVESRSLALFVAR